jgi:hypothetical protein
LVVAVVGSGDNNIVKRARYDPHLDSKPFTAKTGTIECLVLVISNIDISKRYRFSSFHPISKQTHKNIEHTTHILGSK